MKKMKKGVKILLIAVGIVFIIIIGVVFAFTTTKNLGVKYSKADLSSVNTKLGINYNTLATSNNPQDSLKILGQKQLDAQITESELTALLNQPSDQWKNYPVSDIQFKIYDDGSVEITGKIIVDRFEAYSKATDLPDKYKNLVAEKKDLVPINPSFDYKGNYEIKNGELVGEMTELKIGPLEVPKDWTEDNKDFINEFVEDRLNSAGMQVENAKFTNGKLDIEGTIPESISFEQ